MLRILEVYNETQHTWMDNMIQALQVGLCVYVDVCPPTCVGMCVCMHACMQYFMQVFISIRTAEHCHQMPQLLHSFLSFPPNALSMYLPQEMEQLEEGRSDFLKKLYQKYIELNIQVNEAIALVSQCCTEYIAECIGFSVPFFMCIFRPDAYTYCTSIL